MAATVQRDPFSVLIRKIGYSAGLENTRERLLDLVRRYESAGLISNATWYSDLVKGTWNLRTQHIGDVFSALNIIDVHQGAVDILFGLDALAITKRLVPEEKFERAVDAILCALVLISDGDIFLNCLAVDFDPIAVRTQLLNMIRSKRELAHQAIRLSALREKVDRIINIEAQKTNRGSSGSGKGVNLLTRTQPLGQEPGPLARPTDAEPTISDDYLRKVPVKRRDWARSIGLYADSHKTESGRRLLSEIEEIGGRSADGSYALWPFLPELAALHLTEVSAPWPTVSFERLCKIVETVYRPASTASSEEPLDEQIRIFARMLKEYKSLNTPKAALRNELPMRVARLVELGWNVSGGTVLSLSNAVDFDQASPRRRIETRSSRNHEGALVFGRSE